MKKKNNIVQHLKTQNIKVIEVTPTFYTLENGDSIEHTFNIDENMTIEEFQILLNNARDTMIKLLNNIEENIIDNE